MMLKRAVLMAALAASGFLTPLASTLAQQSTSSPGPAGATTPGGAVVSLRERHASVELSQKEDIAKFEEAAKTSQAKDLKQFAQADAAHAEGASQASAIDTRQNGQVTPLFLILLLVTPPKQAACSTLELQQKQAV